MPRPEYPGPGRVSFPGTIDRAMTNFSLRSTPWAAVALTLAACGGAAAPSATPMPVLPAPTPVVVSSSPESIAKAQADSVRLPWVEADASFMSGMVSHHAQAIVMARMAPSHGASRSLLTLAGRVINAQTDEIVIMQQWLSDRRRPIPAANPRGMKMVMNGTEHEMLMPGMLTEAQMTELDRARGPDFDRLFVTFMIQHHKGAVSMVKELFASYGATQDEVVFKFANDVQVDQSTEIARMERMLAGMAQAKPAP